jgi:hypothetical protein
MAGLVAATSSGVDIAGLGPAKAGDAPSKRTVARSDVSFFIRLVPAISPI